MDNDFVLIKPCEEHIDEIRAYRQEILDNGGQFNGDSRLRDFSDTLAWIKQCRLTEHTDTIPNPGWVEADQFILVQKGKNRILGMINFRHYLNEYLAEYGGHIGYGIRPSERRKGYAKIMLNLCLEKCLLFGLHKVLVTCDEVNEASRRTILACGGIFERKTIQDGQVVLERYWITLMPSLPVDLETKLSGFTFRLYGTKTVNLYRNQVNQPFQTITKHHIMR